MNKLTAAAITFFIAAEFAAPPMSVRAADGCDAYPLTDGISAEETNRGPKIMSTATVTVNIDDQSEVIDALKEAEMTAKAQIARFFNEQISSEESIERAVESEVRIVGEQKSASKTELKRQLSSMRNSSQELLRGVVKIGDCYTKGRLVRVSVGIKPETAASAASGQQMMRGSSGSIPNTVQTAPFGGRVNGVDGFNNAGNISKF